MSIKHLKKVQLYCDGSCLKNPGAGGWAYILNYGKKSKIASGCEPHTTNNKMELAAAIEGLKALKEPCEVELWADSSYVVMGINEWLPSWERANFKNKKNVDQWKEMSGLLKTHRVHAIWVKGHAGHPQNEECDKMARDAATTQTAVAPYIATTTPSLF